MIHIIILPDSVCIFELGGIIADQWAPSFSCLSVSHRTRSIKCPPRMIYARYSNCLPSSVDILNQDLVGKVLASIQQAIHITYYKYDVRWQMVDTVHTCKQPAPFVYSLTTTPRPHRSCDNRCLFGTEGCLPRSSDRGLQGSNRSRNNRKHTSKNFQLDSNTLEYHC